MGIAEDYKRIRNQVAVCDLSSMTKISIIGDDRIKMVDQLITGSLDEVYEGMGCHVLFLDPQAKIIALALVFNHDDQLIVFTEQDRGTSLMNWLLSNSEGYAVNVEDITEDYALISLIGVKAQEVTIEIAGEDIIALPYLGFELNQQTGALLFRVGHTGEFEYRFMIPPRDRDSFIRTALKKGNDHGIAQCGTEVLDVLMLEMKSFNQGKELSEEANPIEAGLHWMIDFNKPEFMGKAIVEEQKQSVARKLIVLSTLNGGLPLPGAHVYIEDMKVGTVVNSCFSETLERGLAMAYIEEAFGWVGVKFDVTNDRKQRTTMAAVSAPTFVTKSVRGEVA